MSEDKAPMVLNLVNFKDGALIERIDHEIEQIAKNIWDRNTEPEDKRTLTVKLTFKPKKDREQIIVTAEVKSGMAPSSALGTIAYLIENHDNPKIIGFDPQQLTLEDETKEEPPQLTRIEGGKEN